MILSSVDGASVSDMRSTLGLTKALRANVDLVETTLASALAASERHGDGGIEVLRQASGLTRPEAVRRVKTTKQLKSLPAAREAVERGKLSLTNAHLLVDAARKTAASSVDSDNALLRMAEEMPADDFARHSKAWVARHQDASDLEAQHQRNYNNRHLRFWSDRDGAINLRGSFDAEMGLRIRGHIQHISGELRLNDRRGLRRDRRHPQRNEAQRNADALDRIVRSSLQAAKNRGSRGQSGLSRDNSAASPPSRQGRPSRTPHNDSGRGSSAASSPRERPSQTLRNDSPRGNSAGSTTDTDRECSDRVRKTSTCGTSSVSEADSDFNGAEASNKNGEQGRGTRRRKLSSSDATAASAAGPDTDTDNGFDRNSLIAGSGVRYTRSVGGTRGFGPSLQQGLGHTGKSGTGKTGAEIIVRADFAALSGEPGGLAELVGAGPIPRSVLERLSCNAAISAVLFAGGIKPVYEARTRRAPSVAQRRALIARDGACVGCGADPSDCEAHHIVPWRLCKRTQIDNLVLVCWACHDRIHKHHWKVTQNDDGYTLKPPTRSPRTPNSSQHRGTARVPDYAAKPDPARILDSAQESDRACGLEMAHCGDAQYIPNGIQATRDEPHVRLNGVAGSSMMAEDARPVTERQSSTEPRRDFIQPQLC